MEEQDFLALSVPQRKAVQEDLKAKNLYFGPIDGLSGEGVRTALKSAKKAIADSEIASAAFAEKKRADDLKNKELELEAERLRQAGQSGEVTNAAETAKALRKAAYDKDANSGLGMATQAGANAPAVMAGVGVGRGIGLGVNALMDMSQENKNKALRAAADNRVKGLTTTEGARVGARLAGAMPSESGMARVGGRMWPHFALGSVMMGKGGLMLAQQGEDDPFYPKMVDRASGLGMIGAGTGIFERGITQGVSPGVVPDADAISIINSNQLRRNNAAPEAPTGPTPGTVPALRAEAKAAGITGGYKMNKTQLTDALRKAGTKTPLIAPAIAAAMAYGMTPDEAQAADGSGGGNNQTEALTNAGVAGTTASGASYGLSKLLEKAPNLARALGIGAGEMTMPLMAMDVGPNSQEEANLERSRTAVAHPWLARMLGLHDEMGQMLPERNMGKTDEYAMARGLQIPEGIPSPRPDGSSPYPELVSAMMANPQQAAATPPPLPTRRLIDAMMQGGR